MLFIQNMGVGKITAIEKASIGEIAFNFTKFLLKKKNLLF